MNTLIESNDRSTLPYDPFLCNDCQKLGYCKLRAMRQQQQAARDAQMASQPAPAPSPMLPREPMPSLRELVMEYRPELSRFLPRENQPADTQTKRPSLGEIRAMMNARKNAKTEVSPQEESKLTLAAQANDPLPLAQPTYTKPAAVTPARRIPQTKQKPRKTGKLFTTRWKGASSRPVRTRKKAPEINPGARMLI